MAIPSLQGVGYTAASAMTAFGHGMNAIAHNVANVSTAGFDPLQTNYESGPQDQGVQVSAISPSALPVEAMEAVGIDPPPQATDMTSVLPPEALNPSNTELAREFTNMIATQRAYEANAVSIGTWDTMLGTIVDVRA